MPSEEVPLDINSNILCFDRIVSIKLGYYHHSLGSDQLSDHKPLFVLIEPESHNNQMNGDSKFFMPAYCR
jgi:hypothetical protein